MAGNSAGQQGLVQYTGVPETSKQAAGSKQMALSSHCLPATLMLESEAIA